MSFTGSDSEADRGTAEPPESTETVAPEAAAPRQGNMLPLRQGRRFAVERVLARLVATTGIIGIGVLLGAILGSNKVAGWTMGLVIAIVSVVLAAILWSSRQL